MNGARPLTDAIDVLRRERRVRPGPVPRELDGGPLGIGWEINPDAFLVRHDHFAAIYRRGEGITLDRGTAEPGMIDLWLNGTIYAAIACLNGLFPIHASAVAVGGKLYAFTGPSGGGKSTLVTALGQLGLPLFCDDTLVMDLRGDALLALPGHKRVKLWPESLNLLGMEGTELVSDDYRKFFISASAGDVTEPRELSGLIHLEWGDEVAWQALSASERFVAFDDDHYTRKLFDAASNHGRIDRFRFTARIARDLPMFRFVRPMDPAAFAETTLYVHDRLTMLESQP